MHTTTRPTTGPMGIAAIAVALALTGAACAADDIDGEPLVGVDSAQPATTIVDTVTTTTGDTVTTNDTVTINDTVATTEDDVAAADDSAPDELAGGLATIVEATGVPALGAMTIDSAGVLDAAVAGVRQRGAETPATVEDRFHIGSNTKAMTAAIVGRLGARGAGIGFDTTLADAFPDVAVHAGYAEITIADLLAHVGGTPDDGRLPAGIEAVEELPVTEGRAAAAAMVLAEPPVIEAHTVSTYSNVGYVIVGAAIEAATGATWEELARSEVFDVLGMESCGFGAPGVEDELTEPRGHDESGEPVFEDLPPVVGPAGTVHCTMADWGLFLVEMLNGMDGESDYLDQAAIERLFTPVAPMNGAPELGYALGWIVTEGPDGPAFLHNGSNGSWYSEAYIIPGVDRAALFVSNEESTGQLAVPEALAFVAAGFSS